MSGLLLLIPIALIMGLGALVVGVPVREDGTKSAIVKKIEKFIEELRGQIEIPVIEYDESFSTQAAFQTMIAGGMKKKQRQQNKRPGAAKHPGRLEHDRVMVLSSRNPGRGRTVDQADLGGHAGERHGHQAACARC